MTFRTLLWLNGNMVATNVFFFNLVSHIIHPELTHHFYGEDQYTSILVLFRNCHSNSGMEQPKTLPITSYFSSKR